MQVRDVMSPGVKTLQPSDTVRRAVRLLAEHGVGGMPVVEEGALVGLLSETDVLEGLRTHHKKLRMLMPPEISFGISFVEVLEEREASKALEEIGDASVTDIMTKDVATVSPEASIGQAIRTMVQREVHRLVVVERDKVVGIVTRGDVLRGFLRSLAE